MDMETRCHTPQALNRIFSAPRFSNSPNVSNVTGVESNNVNTLDVNVGDRLKEENAKNIAVTLGKGLDDLESYNYYLKCAKEHPADLLYECLSIVLRAKKEGRIRSKPAKYFVGVLKIKSRRK